MPKMSGNLGARLLCIDIVAECFFDRATRSARVAVAFGSYGILILLVITSFGRTGPAIRHTCHGLGNANCNGASQASRSQTCLGTWEIDRLAADSNLLSCVER